MRPAEEYNSAFSRMGVYLSRADVATLARNELLEELMGLSKIIGNEECVPIGAIEKLWKECAKK
jgi:hypothetical protein